MDELAEAIAKLEGDVRHYCRAIRRAERRRLKHLILAEAQRQKAARTRAQHLDRTNRLLADLMIVQSQIEGMNDA